MKIKKKKKKYSPLKKSISHTSVIQSKFSTSIHYGYSTLLTLFYFFNLIINLTFSVLLSSSNFLFATFLCLLFLFPNPTNNTSIF